jgi:hypothetical protein
VKPILRLVGGFGALILGAIIALPVPEFGIPLVLIGTRLLGDRYLWASQLNNISLGIHDVVARQSVQSK